MSRSERRTRPSSNKVSLGFFLKYQILMAIRLLPIDCTKIAVNFTNTNLTDFNLLGFVGNSRYTPFQRAMTITVDNIRGTSETFPMKNVNSRVLQAPTLLKREMLFSHRFPPQLC